MRTFNQETAVCDGDVLGASRRHFDIVVARPLAIDLYCGLGGWAEGFLAEGYDVIGFDIERHDYPGQLVLQDVATLDGRQFRGATVIVASPPCQAYCYRAMPWKRARALPPPSNELFEACFRIAREASAAPTICPQCDGTGREHQMIDSVIRHWATKECHVCGATGKVAGRHIPLVVENVRGAQPWVGRAKARYGSYYLWGDIESIGGAIVGTRVEFGAARLRAAKQRGVKCAGNDTFKLTGSPCGKLTDPRYPSKTEGIKQHGSGAAWFDKALDERRTAKDLGLKGPDGKSWIRNRECDPRPSHGNSPARKAASAAIAKIPFELAQWIARCYKPHPSGQLARRPEESPITSRDLRVKQN